MGHVPLCWLGQLGTWRLLRPAQHPGCPGRAPQDQAQPVLRTVPPTGTTGGGLSGSTASSEEGNSLETIWVRVTSSDASGPAGWDMRDR